ncbi:FAS1 domain-containing protein [Hyaloraphidium curvatum]|nr:FAS1 domain-containing protein [Hyaloraphidium curvatum]
MKVAATAAALLSLSAAAFAAPAVFPRQAPTSHCLDALLQVNTGANPKPYNFTTLVSLASPIDLVVRVLSGQVASLPEITLFAPTDDAFGTFVQSVGGSVPPSIVPLIPEILSYHVSNGTLDPANLPAVSGISTLLGNGSLSNISPQILLATKPASGSPPLLLTYGLGNSGVIDTIPCSNGVIHVVNSVLYPPNPTTATALIANLTSLAGALNATGLLETVDELPALTVFAPTNEAFAAVASVAANLTTAQITNVLTYHAIPARVMSFDLAASQNATTVNGAALPIRVENGTVFVGTGGAKVVAANVLTANGVVHVIDQVLIPPTL